MERRSVTSGKFECPKDFAEVINTEGLCLEDIDDDSELFIIQAPVDADITKFHDHQLVLSRPTTFSYTGADGEEEEMYKCTTVAADKQLAKACLILPERNSLKLCAVEKCIEGVIYIEKRAAFPQIGYPKELYAEIKALTNLKKRADPLSSGNHTVLSGDFDKKIATDDLPRENELSSHHVKKKKHHRHIQDESLPEDIPVKSKKKHKHHRERRELKDNEIDQESALFSETIKEETDDGNSFCMDSLNEELSPDKKKKSK